MPLCALLCTAYGGVAFAADNYPSKPIRMVVGFPPGGATDLVARIIQPGMSTALGQQVVIDNRAGANGIIAGELTARADPDGYTILFGHIGMLVISPAIQKVPYDTFKDFAPIGQTVSLQNFIITHPAVPVKTLKDLIALAKAKPDQLNYATSGIGSPGHLAAVLLESMAGIKLVHIPYKGGGPAITDLLAPAKTPAQVIDRLNKEMVAALKAPEFVEGLKSRGIDAAPSSPAEFAAYIRAENTKWSKVIKQSGIKGEG